MRGSSTRELAAAPASVGAGTAGVGGTEVRIKVFLPPEPLYATVATLRSPRGRLGGDGGGGGGAGGGGGGASALPLASPARLEEDVLSFESVLGIELRDDLVGGGGAPPGARVASIGGVSSLHARIRAHAGLTAFDPLSALSLGDVLCSVNGKPVADCAEAREALRCAVLDEVSSCFAEPRRPATRALLDLVFRRHDRA